MSRRKQTKGVLVLNYDMTFLGFTSVRKAMIKVVKGHAVILKSTAHKLHDQYLKPLVIQLITAVRRFYGKSVKWNKRNIFIRDGNTCQYCGTKAERLTIDHVIPKSRGGGNTWQNTVACCIACNSAKGDKTPTEAHMFLKRKPVHPTIMEFLQIKAQNMNAYDILVECGVY